MVNEGRDIFGFEREPKEKPKSQDESPIIRIDSEIMIETMLKSDINGQEPFSAFADQIQWGRHPGAVKMVISPLGSFKSIIRKLQVNLEGNEVWVCKSIMPYNDIMHANVAFDEAFAMNIFEHIEKVHKMEIDAPDRNWSGLERLTLKTASLCRRKDIIPEIFIYKGIKQIIKNENYLIYFECRGQGVEAPGSARLEQFIIDMSYNKSTGMVRSFGHDVQSPMKRHLWYNQPSEWDEYFSPSQEPREIAEAIGAALSTY